MQEPPHIHYRETRLSVAASGRFRILLVEDSIEEAFLVKALVESEGLGEVVVAQDGVHGAHLGRGGVFDLIVCDLNLPGTDGVEVVRASKQEYPERPIIVTTGYADPEIHERARQAGADRVLTKPLNRERFLEALWALLARGGSGMEGGAQTILAVGAYPGDVELGVGGILAGHIRKGGRAVVLTLSKSFSSGTDLSDLAQESAQRLGVTLVLGDPTPMDELEAASMLRRYLKIHAPDTVLIPSEHERDRHRLAAHRAALTVVLPHCHVFAYQTRTSTLDFRPNVFAGVQRVMGRKVRALEAFSGPEELAHLDPALARAAARYWSRSSKHPEVEPLARLQSPVVVPDRGPSDSTTNGRTPEPAWAIDDI
jgi:CheY-like chemotaxis protein